MFQGSYKCVTRVLWRGYRAMQSVWRRTWKPWTNAWGDDDDDGDGDDDGAGAGDDDPAPIGRQMAKWD